MQSSMGTREKIAAVSWYLKRPSLYPDFLRQLRRLPTLKAERARNLENGTAGDSWCRSNVSTYEDFARAIDISPTLARLSTAHATDWQIALEAHAACPVRMGGPTNVDLVFNLCRELRPENVLETGVAYGWSSLAILLAMDDIQEGRLVSIDRPYPLLDNDAVVGCVVPEWLRSRWTLIRRADRDALPGALSDLKPLDLAHYDSDKSYSGRTYAYDQIWSALRTGGLLVSDDIADNLAFKVFAEQVQRTPYVFGKSGEGYVGILVK